MTDRLKKLYALAARGVGGEQKNAKVALRRMLDRKGLTMEDVERMLGVCDHPSQWQFKYADPYEFRLLCRIVDHLVKDWNGAYYRLRGSRSRCSFLLTDAQYIEAAFLFEVLLPPLREALAEYTVVFAWKNGLAPNRDLADPSPRSLEEELRLASLYSAAKRIEIRKAIGAAS